MNLWLVQGPVRGEDALSTGSEPQMWSCHSHTPDGRPDLGPEPSDSLCDTSQAAQEQEASFRMEGAWEGAEGFWGTRDRGLEWLRYTACPSGFVRTGPRHCRC